MITRHYSTVCRWPQTKTYKHITTNDKTNSWQHFNPSYESHLHMRILARPTNGRTKRLQNGILFIGGRKHLGAISKALYFIHSVNGWVTIFTLVAFIMAKKKKGRGCSESIFNAIFFNVTWRLTCKWNRLLITLWWTGCLICNVQAVWPKGTENLDWYRPPIGKLRIKIARFIMSYQKTVFLTVELRRIKLKNNGKISHINWPIN